MSKPMQVGEALEAFMAKGEAWGCRIVARANPSEAFKPVGGKIPALWLEREGGFERCSRGLFKALPPDARASAARACARQLTAEAAEPLGPILEFGRHWPRASSQRLDLARLNLERSLVALFESAAAAPGCDVEALSQAAREGLEQGLADCAKSTPALAAAILALDWDAVAWAALVGAEKSALRLDSKEGVRGRRRAL